MLGKLIKHEFKSTYKPFLSMYMVLISMGFLTLLAVRLDFFNLGILQAFRSILCFGFGVSLVIVPIAVIIYIGYRFYENLFTDEGYLMFTLPVPKSSLILSKYITSIVWVMGSIAAILLSLCLFIFGSSDIREYVDMLTRFFQEFSGIILGDSHAVLYVSVFFGIAYILYLVSFIFMALSFGQLIIPKHKILGAVLAYFALQIIQEIISSIVAGVFYVLGYIDLNSSTVPTSFIFTFGIMLLAFAVLWLSLTNVICKKKLNLS